MIEIDANFDDGLVSGGHPIVESVSQNRISRYLSVSLGINHRSGLESEEDFDKHFPVEVTTRDFVYNWSLRDERSKVNEVKGMLVHQRCIVASKLYNKYVMLKI